MKTVCLYFQVHQPWRLKKYRFFNMGKDHNYLDDLMNRSIMQKVARQCYLPMNALLLKLIRENKGKFRCSFSITGIAIEQFRAFAPEVLDSFKELAATGCVEFLAETYSHSLASLASKEDFTEQVKLHTNLIKKEFGVKPTAFRNTELIYSDEIGATVAGMGFRTMLAEGAKHVLGWKSPNYVYANAIDQKLRLLLRNYKLSDDIAFRFSNKSWDQWPLTADKYVQWLASDETPGEVINLFMDYETFGEHQNADTGIFEFMRALPKAILARKNGLEFATVTEAEKKHQPVAVLHSPHVKSSYDDERDVFWVSGAAFCCRADVFRALGGFDGDFFAHMEEIDLCWRMQLAGYRVRIVPRSRVYHLGGGTLQTDSPAKVFYNHRNNLAMLYKCASPAQRLCVAVARPALDLLAALSYLMQGRRDNFRAVFRAWRDFIRWHGALARKRREIRANRKGSAAENIYRGSVVLRYLFGRRTFGGMMR